MKYLFIVALYIIIGGILHGIYHSEETKDNYTAAFIWPIAVLLSIGEWIGERIKKLFKID
jgi:hypothetical protein